MIFRSDPTQHLTRDLASKWQSTRSLRQRIDTKADLVIRELVKLQRLDANILKSTRSLAASKGGPFREFIDNANRVPHWVNFEKIKLGQKKVLSHAIQCNLAILLGSMIESFCEPGQARMITTLGSSKDSLRNRIYQTVQFIYTLNNAHSLKPSSQAHDIILQARLMNAASRHLIWQHQRPWPGHLGQPVSQFDYLRNLLMHSLVFSRSLERLGIVLNDAERSSIQHLWRYVGFCMGIDDELLPRDIGEENLLYQHLHETLEPSPECQALTKKMIEFLAFRSPFFLPASALFEISRSLISDKLADQLSFKRSTWWGSLARSLQPTTILLDKIQQSLPWGNLVAQQAGDFITREMISEGLQGQGSSLNKSA